VIGMVPMFGPGFLDYTEMTGACEKAATGRVLITAARGPTFPLFLLFLQEIISERHGVRRRNPQISSARRRKEQRLIA
jgi:hypothetical protein